ncbi:MAG: hypothetical protein ABSA78_20750 [Candidatus Sulfotelmatobacter sp.]|jgi:hypothetical protein
MARVSPTLEGFRAAFRRPSLTFAEIAWRWTVGGVGWALFLFWLIEYLDSLPVSNGDATLLRTRQPMLVGRAISHILRGSMGRALLGALLAALAISFLWIVVGSIGRTATVRALLDYFRSRVSQEAPPEAPEQSASFRSLLGLNFLRVAVALGAMLALLGAAILTGFASPEAKPRPGLAFILFLPLAGLICIVWPLLNWLLSLASIFAVRDQQDWLGSLLTAVAFFRERSGPVLAVGTWTGLAHLVAFSVASTVISMPLAFLQVAPWRLVMIGVSLVTLAYLAVADWLYMARLAGYVCIAEMPEEPVQSAALSAPPDAGQNVISSAAAQTIDRDEVILSDLPNLAIETS